MVTGKAVAMIRRSIFVATVLLLAGCGSDEAERAAQPAPGVTTFEQGRFDDLPRYPRSEPLGPRSEKDGVVAQSFRATGAEPQQVLEWYRDELGQGWIMLTPIERLGVGTVRADWVQGEYRLRVSATREAELENRDDAARKVVSQYSVSLQPA